MKNFGNDTKLNDTIYTGSLKEQPIFDGYGIASSQLNDGQCVTNNNTLQSLENNLKFNQLTGRINYGARQLSKQSRKKSRKIKKLNKKIKKSLKKLNKLKNKKSRKFGGSLEQNTHLGLPDYETSPLSIYNNNYLLRGARPPIPYGPVDNARMSMLTQYNGFGTRTRTAGARTRTAGSSGSSKKRFGQTPGSNDWHLHKETPLEQTLQSYAQPYLAQAKGMFSPDVELYGRATSASYLNQSSTPSFNVPMQYSDNQYNYPVVGNSVSNFGKSRSRFGAMLPSSNMYGPNNVGHESQIPMYHAGSTTINFADNQLYSPIGIVGGPTNSTGEYASLGTSPEQVLNVQNDGITPNAYLSKFRFGELIPNISSIANGSGLLTLAQPLPSYLDKNREVVGGDYLSFGLKKKLKKVLPVKPVIKPVPKHQHTKKPKLVPVGTKAVSSEKSKKPVSKKCFGKSTLTLDKVGTVNITKNPN
jgi:hypothetical protein